MEWVSKATFALPSLSEQILNHFTLFTQVYVGLWKIIMHLRYTIGNHGCAYKKV